MKTLTIMHIILVTTLLLSATSPAQWVQTNGPYGGNVFSLVTCPPQRDPMLS